MASATLLQRSLSGTWIKTAIDIHEAQTASASPVQYFLIVQDIFSIPNQFPDDLRRFFCIPELLYTSLYQQSNGFFGFDEERNEKGRLNLHRSWFRCQIKMISFHNISNTQYVWQQLTLFSYWTPNQHRILCIGLPSTIDLPSILLSQANWRSETTSTPFSLYLPVIETILNLYDQSIWAIRDVVRAVEENRIVSVTGGNQFLTLHEASRHAIHSSETLKVTITGLERMQRECFGLFKDAELKHPDSQETREHKKVHDSLEFQAHDLIAQRDSQVMHNLGKAAQSDSSAMKVIAVVTMSFLPATFIATLFSMSFFSFSPGTAEQPAQWSVSQNFWLYWVFAVPITGLTIASWFFREKFGHLKALSRR
ncbi:hypothetical protein NA57DRAFT_71615 [Rhizodiscina lignyota]|uniref:Uncharacterized protein n=1 Tax=Rhizodiscina lignyota TaxID=1504668 RepID=A0A9P4M9C0_9PEZI|nr:hypothetical protein NA57DRAFT_71615 [Rhizodiscina lignyota]